MESKIIVNGKELTFAQAMSVRVALEVYVQFLAGKGLGPGDLPEKLTGNYIARSREVLELIHL